MTHAASTLCIEILSSVVRPGDRWTWTTFQNGPKPMRHCRRLATLILDPVSERFGPINLTYGVATRQLIKVIRHDVAPKIDQHSSYEQSAAGKIICSRGGAACDFVVKEVDSMVVAQWIVEHTRFDRLYYYGADRPIHVSATDEPIGQCVIIRREQESRRVLPTVISNEKFLALRA